MWRTQRTNVLIDGHPIATLVRPTMQAPWIETTIGPEGRVLIVQVQPEAWEVDTVVFVDGVSLNDGRSLGEWRSTKPAPVDEFEAVFRGGFWTAKGGLFLAISGLLPGLAQLIRAFGPYWLGFEVAVFLVVFGWWMLVLRLVRWLRTKSMWPNRLRRFIVMLVGPLGGFVVFLLLAQLFYVLR